MNVRLKTWVALVVTAVLLALPALAADPHGIDNAAEGAAHESPPLFSVNPGLMIWTVITFAVVLVVLRMTAWGPLMASLAEREKNISGAIDDAKKIKVEAEELFARYQTMIDTSKDEAREILEAARRDGKTVQEEIRARAAQEAEEFKERAHREIELAKDTALQEIWGLAANLSTELATRILGRTMNESDQDRLVRELIEEMRAESGGKAPVGTGSESA